MPPYSCGITLVCETLFTNRRTVALRKSVHVSFRWCNFPRASHICATQFRRKLHVSLKLLWTKLLHYSHRHNCSYIIPVLHGYFQLTFDYFLTSAPLDRQHVRRPSKQPFRTLHSISRGAPVDVYGPTSLPFCARPPSTPWNDHQSVLRNWLYWSTVVLATFSQNTASVPETRALRET